MNAQETNTVISGADGYALVEKVNHDNFKLMLDFYHIGKANENLAIVKAAEDKLVHCHIATVPDRKFPIKERLENYAPFFSALREIGYVGGISVEADFAGERPDGVWHLHNMFINT